MNHSIEVQDLSRSFGTFTAVDHITFRVDRGEIFGFLGANGAGKSTTIRMLCGLLTPTSGTARVGGFEVTAQPESVKQVIGYMSQRFSLYDDLTVSENLQFFGKAYGLNGTLLKNRISWALETIGLSGRQDSLTRNLAVGWKQRLALASAVLHQPQIVFLDEPTGGVDPVARRIFWDLIHQLADQGITVLVTTHYLDEAEYCEHIVLIQAGRIIADGSPRALKTRHIPGVMYELRCDDTVRAMDVLKASGRVIEVSIFGTRLHVGVRQEHDRQALDRLLEQNDVQVRSWSAIVPTLEDVFLYLNA